MIVTAERLSQPQNKPSLISVPALITAVVMLSHSSYTYSPRSVTVTGIVAEVNESQLENALLPIFEIPAGKLTAIRAVHSANASLPIVVVEAPTSTAVRDLQFLNAASPTTPPIPTESDVSSLQFSNAP